jgi:hypothetical protein
MIDKDGFPGTRGDDEQFDGGDTAAIIGTCLALRLSNVEGVFLPDLRRKLITEDGPVRHPDKSKWYGWPDRFSRDQLVAILCSYVTHFDQSAETLFRHHKKKLFLTAWNSKKNHALDAPKKMPDLTGPEVWALWIRIFKPWWWWMVLWALDLETLLGAIMWKFRKSRITRNHMLICIVGLSNLSTPIMDLAYCINDWDDLIERWTKHCQDAKEYQTGILFDKSIS